MRNVLLVVFDTARADSFEPYGAPAGTTPTIAQLASSGTAVPYVVAPSNWTLPSHASMFTGSLPGALGLTSGTKVGSKAGMSSRVLIEERADRVLAEVLRTKGYRTAAISANPWIHEVNGFATGFEIFHSIRGTERKPRAGGLWGRIDWAIDAWRARADDGAATAGHIVRKWIDDRHPDEPFFWFVNLMECHSPYLPPRPYNDLPGWERIKAARDAAAYQTPEGAYRVCVGDLRMGEETVARSRHLYRRSVKQMDAWLGMVVEELDRRKILDETLIVVASDHGENLGEDGLIGHLISMSERLISVPVVFSAPVAVGHDGPASLAELPRLLAEALDIGDHPWTEDVRPGGVAVSQVAGQILLPEKETLARAWGIPDEAIRRIAVPMTSATDGRLKLVRDDRGERLYDLRADPGERSPLAAGSGAGPETALRAAIEHVDALAPSEPGPAPLADAESADLEERLRQLGYI